MYINQWNWFLRWCLCYVWFDKIWREIVVKVKFDWILRISTCGTRVKELNSRIPPSELFVKRKSTNFTMDINISSHQSEPVIDTWPKLPQRLFKNWSMTRNESEFESSGKNFCVAKQDGMLSSFLPVHILFSWLSHIKGHSGGSTGIYHFWTSQ